MEERLLGLVCRLRKRVVGSHCSCCCCFLPASRGADVATLFLTARGAISRAHGAAATAAGLTWSLEVRMPLARAFSYMRAVKHYAHCAARLVRAASGVHERERWGDTEGARVATLQYNAVSCVFCFFLVPACLLSAHSQDSQPVPRPRLRPSACSQGHG